MKSPLILFSGLGEKNISSAKLIREISAVKGAGKGKQLINFSLANIIATKPLNLGEKINKLKNMKVKKAKNKKIKVSGAKSSFFILNFNFNIFFLKLLKFRIKNIKKRSKKKNITWTKIKNKLLIFTNYNIITHSFYNNLMLLDKNNPFFFLGENTPLVNLLKKKRKYFILFYFLEKLVDKYFFYHKFLLELKYICTIFINFLLNQIKFHFSF